MFLIHRIDPRMGIPETYSRITTAAEAKALVMENLAYWEGMVTRDPAEPREMPYGTKVTLNTDWADDDPSVYFLTITYPDSYRDDPAYLGDGHQTDLFFVIRDDIDPEGDISEINGAQCGDCGRINCAPVGATALPDDVVPVWRTHPDTPNTLCDACADKAYGEDPATSVATA